MDLTLDNQHKFKIMATMGGTYNNNRNRVIDFVVDESLCANLFMPIMILLCYLCLRSIISWLLIRLYFRRVLNSTV